KRFVAAYGYQGRMVAAVAVNMPRWLPGYQALIEAGAPFPPDLHAADGPTELRTVAAGFPPLGQPTHSPAAAPTGPGPSAPPPAPARAAPPPGRAPPTPERAAPRAPPGAPPL